MDTLDVLQKKDTFRHLGHTASGRSIDWFTQEQVERGLWREEEISSEISGLSRPIEVYRAARKTNLITYDWHGDKQTFCPPMGSPAILMKLARLLQPRIRRQKWLTFHFLSSSIECYPAAREKGASGRGYPGAG